MRFRKLRIAWSVMCGIACVLLIVLWVRSYSVVDFWSLPITAQYSITLGSVPGEIPIGITGYADTTATHLITVPTEKWQTEATTVPSALFGGITRVERDVQVWVPSWFLVASTAAFAIVPWLRWRFSLRTLLIATTLVAVLLGLIVWLARR
jgi:hypothetical protein